MSRFEFERIDLAMASLLANELVASDSERAYDQSQSEATGQSELFVPVSRHRIYFNLLYRQLTVNIVVSAI